MAWLTNESNNKDLVDKLCEHNIIQSAVVKNAFQLVDRGDFVPREHR